MADYTMLKVKMREKGFTSVSKLAAAANMPGDALRSRIRGKTPWKLSDAQKLSNVLELTQEEVMTYFFKK